MIYFSKKTNAFYRDGVSAAIPADAVEIDESLYSELLTAQAAGLEIKMDELGQLVAAMPDGCLCALDVVKSELRDYRVPMLDALTGIAGREARKATRLRQEQAQALAQDDTELAQQLGEQAEAAEALEVEADALAKALLDITDNPALNSAQTMADMQAAGVAAYRAIAATASAGLASVFKGITVP